MQLKKFQVEILDKLTSFLLRLRGQRALAEQFAEFCRQRGMPEAPVTFAKKAWDDARASGELPPGSQAWIELLDAMSREVPSVCLKVPTGGGKTLLGAQAVGRVMDNLFNRKTGIIVWVVPSEAILSQTIRAFQNPVHPYRTALEVAANGRLRVLTKSDRFALDDVTNGLCVLVVMLQSAVREEADALRVFRDSGGFPSFFPKVDDAIGNQKLIAEVHNLDRIEVGKTGIPGVTVRHSLANVLRLLRPMIVVDEGHRAYSDLARASLLGLNPSFILELTATPNMTAVRSNVLVSVGGVALKNEALVKLPINVTANVGDTWKAAIRRAMTIRSDLEVKAVADFKVTGRRIRPIALVRVEATGARRPDDQRVHADDVKQFLQSSMRIPDSWIRLKTASVNELGDENLLAADCEVRVVLTKDALREGWDCPFAYVLVVLNARSGPTAITQMVGRVLRQPYACISRAPELNEAYVVCITSDVQRAVDSVSAGLEEEGLSDAAGLVRSTSSGAATAGVTSRSKACRGQFLIPVVAIRTGNVWEEFDPERHLLGQVDWKALPCPDTSTFQPSVEIEQVQAAIGLLEVTGKPAVTVRHSSQLIRTSGLDDYGPAVGLLQSVVPNVWNALDLLRTAEASLLRRGIPLEDLPLCRLQLAEFLRIRLWTVVDQQLERIFRAGIDSGKIQFLASPIDGLGRPLPTNVNVRLLPGDRVVKHANGHPFGRNAFSEIYESHLNPLELAVVRELDTRKDVNWWWRVPVFSEWSLVGWRRDRIYPDVIANATTGTKNRLLILESKGAHLLGNADTAYKKSVIGLLQGVYASSTTGKSRHGARKNSAPQKANANYAVASECRGSVLQEISWQTDLAAVFL